MGWFRKIFSPSISSIEMEQPADSALQAQPVVSEPRSFPVTQLNIKDSFPNDVAVLYVQMDGENKFQLVGMSSLSDLNVREEGKPPHSIGESVSAGREAGEIRLAFVEYSSKRSRLKQWLLSLINEFGEDLKLIIVDHTPYEIPWELIDLKERLYLGATISTVRWLTTCTPDANEHFLTVTADESNGRTLSCYVREVDQREIEAEALRTLDSEGIEDLVLFFKALLLQDSGVGMVLVSSHVFFTPGTTREISMGSLVEAHKRLSLTTFREAELKLLKESEPIVFLNGCDSARLTMERERFVDSYHRGFPEVFLSKGAKGFIGTLGPVRDQHASEFARDFISKTLAMPHLSVAAILKELRSEAVRGLPIPIIAEPQAVKFLNTFMYVYYGNPMTNLKLNRRKP